MQTKLPWLCALLLGVIGWLVGFFMNGSNARSREDDASRNSSAARLASRRSPGRVAANTRDFEQLAAEILEGPGTQRQTQRLFELLDPLEASEMPAALNAALHLPAEQRYLLINPLFERWSEIDPRTAAQYAATLPQNEWARTSVIFNWSAHDFPAAAEFARNLPAGPERNQSIGVLAKRLAEKDSAAALKFFDENVPAEQRQEVLTRLTILEEFARKDASAVFAYALGLTDLKARQNAISQAARARVTSSPQEALAWLEQIPDLSARENTTAWALFDWAKSDPRAVLTYARTQLSGSMQANAIGNAIGHLATTDLAAAQAVVEELPATALRTQATRLASALAQRDPKAATRYLRSLPEGEMRSQVISSLTQQLAAKDTAGALELVNSLPAGEQRSDALQEISHTWASTDPVAAADYFLQNPTTNEEVNQVLISLLDGWARWNPNAAFAWVAKLPEGKSKASALPRVIGQLAADDPRTATALALELSGEQRSAAVASVAATWADSDLASASAWVGSMPEGQARAGATAAVIGVWAKGDPASAARWLEALPEGESRDHGAQTFSSRIQELDPEGAATWAATIRDPRLRESTIQGVARNWLRRNPSAAREWIGRTPLLDEEARNELLRSGNG